MAQERDDMLTLDPELQTIFAKYGRPKPFLPTRETISKFREILHKANLRYMKSPFAVKSLGLDSSPPTWSETDIQVTVRDGSRISLRVFRPQALPPEGCAVLVFAHGGGWCMGDLEMDAFTCRLFCKELRVLVFSVGYRLYPDVEFPVPILDSYDAVQWVAQNASTYGGNLRKGFIVGGSSGGGTFMSIAAHLARDDKLQPPITGQYLACPILGDEYLDSDGSIQHLFPGKYSSQQENWDAPLQDAATKNRMSEMATFDRKSPLMSPFNFGNHAKLPVAYIQVCGLDPWRDGGFIYRDLVQEGGSKAKADVYKGLPHCWWNVYPTINATERWRRDTLRGLKWLLKCGDEGQAFKL
ncbi:MAG: hypothetical protein M1820_002771 [Bogoriella megaspora]|nr:MAG: hypothetical protein M1820_002771 [Bogoriella megaspora]